MSTRAGVLQADGRIAPASFDILWQEDLRKVLEEVQLVPQSGQLPGTLSSGQRRRLALATAFVRPRKLLILDEPEQRLDIEGVAWLAQRLKSERQKGLAIVFASHEPELVDTVATRVIELGAPRG
jgi:ATPase subunit of ABC transporter with duplicated ATPase domains